MAAVVVFAGQANAIVTPPDDPPPSNPVQYSLISDVNGQCLDVYKLSDGTYGYWTTRQCNGSSSQKFQTIYGSGYASVRDVKNQACMMMYTNSFVSGYDCDGSISVRWTPVSGPNGSTQWRSQYNGLCLGIPVPAGSEFRPEGRSCTDTSTYWHFG
ncbi:ricin-type beta-trefoil lectin domain protein [Pseudofrankia sp. EUN1h]|uniref:RICIN domain-containing protein n=2 Tax=Pseudofrankia TaxID=2994363 RepID=UPI0012FEEA97